MNKSLVLGTGLVTLGLVALASSGQSLSMDGGKPVAQDIAPVKGSTVLNVNSDELARSIGRIVNSMGAHLGKSPRGNAVVNFSGPVEKFDDKCVYPIVNDRTGDRGTFAGFASRQEYLSNRPERVGFTGMIDLNSKHRAKLTGDVLLELSLKPIDAAHTRLEFWSNCIADTELGRKPADSTGKVERIFLGQLAPGLNLDTWTATASSALEAAAEVDYRARTEFDPNDIHRSVLRNLHSGVPDRTRVTVATDSAVDVVWRAAILATRRFAELRSLGVTGTDERFHRIQNGDASVVSGDRNWKEDFTTTVTDAGNGHARISVTRRLLVPSSDGLTWHGYSSDGEMESWLIAEILKEAVTDHREVIEIHGEPPSAPVPLEPVASAVIPAETPKVGNAVDVAISSSVENADVYVDGHFVGNTPLPNYRLLPGPHVIEVRAEGYETWRREISVTADAATRVRAQLRKLP